MTIDQENDYLSDQGIGSDASEELRKAIRETVAYKFYEMHLAYNDLMFSINEKLKALGLENIK